MKQFFFILILSFSFPFPGETQDHVTFRDLENYPELKYDNIFSDEFAKSQPNSIRVLYYEYDGLYHGIKKPDFRQLLNYKNLEYLEIRKCFLDSLPAEIFQLSNLKILDLNANHHLAQIPENIRMLSKLEEIRLEDCSDFIKINSLAKVPSLRCLRLSGLSILPDGLKFLTQLSELEIDNSPNLNWKELTAILATFPAFKKLIIKNNEFEILPTGIERLTNLEELDLSKNEHIKWETELPRLSSLLVLNKISLQYCFPYGKELPIALGNLRQVERLDLSLSAFIDQWVVVLAQLHLKQLILSNCFIKNLQPLSKLVTLEELNVSDNLLCSISPDISRLKSLKKLDLSCYGDCYYSESCTDTLLSTNAIIYLAQLPLTTLKFSGRGCNDLPDNLGLLIHLEELDISHGKFNIIPENVGKLSNLRILDMRFSLDYEVIKTTSVEPVIVKHAFDLKKSSSTILQLKKLEIFDLRKTYLGKQKKELKRIHKSIPACKVVL